MVKALESSSSSNNTPTTNAPTISTTSMISGLMGSNKQTLEELASLKRQNLELKNLEKLRPQLLELQQQISQLKQNHEIDIKKLYEENIVLTKDNENMVQSLSTLNNTLENKLTELNHLKSIISEYTEKNNSLEKQLSEIHNQILEYQTEIEYIRSISADPVVVDELTQKNEELAGKFIITS
jgi:chromosome segregation ATPase